MAKRRYFTPQGAQYLSRVSYITTLQQHGVEISIAARGRPWENGYAERLIRTLKEKEVDINNYEDIHEVRVRIGHFITNAPFSVRVFDTSGISTKTLILTLANLRPK